MVKSTKLDKFGRSHGLSTKEWKEWLETGNMGPILDEIKRRQPDLWPMFSAVYESLLADPELKFTNPIEALRVTLYAMRELRLLVYELKTPLKDLPDTHPQLMNAIARGVQTAETIKDRYRVVTVKSALFSEMQGHLDSLKLEIKFKDDAPSIDADVDVFEGAFRVKKDEDEEEDDDEYDG